MFFYIRLNLVKILNVSTFSTPQLFTDATCHQSSPIDIVRLRIEYCCGEIDSRVFVFFLVFFQKSRLRRVVGKRKNVFSFVHIDMVITSLCYHIYKGQRPHMSKKWNTLVVLRGVDIFSIIQFSLFAKNKNPFL